MTIEKDIINNKIDKAPSLVLWTHGEGLDHKDPTCYVDVVGSSALLSFNQDEPFTLSAIIKPDTFDGGLGFMPVSKINNLQKGYFLTAFEGYFIFSMRLSASFERRLVFVSSAVGAGKRSHIVVSNLDSDINNIKGYVNGISVNGGNPINNLGANSIVNIVNVQSGTYTNNSPVPADGIVNDIKIFDKQLTDEEAYQLYLKRGQIVPISSNPNLVLDMRFNSKAGTVTKEKSSNNFSSNLVNFSNTGLGAGNSWVDQNDNSITQY